MTYLELFFWDNQNKVASWHIRVLGPSVLGLKGGWQGSGSLVDDRNEQNRSSVLKMDLFSWNLFKIRNIDSEIFKPQRALQVEENTITFISQLKTQNETHTCFKYEILLFHSV